jgi:fatty acid desaturase
MTMLTGPDAYAGIRKGERGRHDYVIDGPTFALACGTYTAFLLATFGYHVLPWYVACPLTAIIIAFHGSLQHEATHGYPTRWTGLNSFIVGWPLWLWLPYLEYRKMHLRHHIDENLTDPTIDPESNYLTPAQLARLSPLHRLTRQAMRPLLGRMLIGPAYFSLMVLGSLFRALRDGNWQELRRWACHLPAVALILCWASHVCGIPLWVYIFGMAYPGTSLALVRSFAEHRAHPTVAGRTVICEAGPFWGSLFLFNNLHVIHHEEPGLVWYRRHARYLARREELTGRDGSYILPGYGTLFAKYSLSPKEPLLHPIIDSR